jgi:hypothetical protein
VCPMLRMNFPNIEIGRCIDDSPQALWEVLTDTTRWVLWGPSITAVECSDRYIRKGSTGRVRTAVGLWAPFLIAELDCGRYWSWRVFGVPATGHRIDRLGQDMCRMIFEVPVFAAPYVIVCRIALHRIARILKSP